MAVSATGVCMDLITSGGFWIALGKIIWVDILLSGDNAVVIALAARNLKPAQRTKAIFFGGAAAIVTRILLTFFAVQLLQYPYLKIVGAVLLFWIGVQLLLPEDESGDGIESSGHLWAAIRTIMIADVVMSLDNVLAVAAAAESGPEESRFLLLMIGLGLSIPFIIFGSRFLLSLMEKFPLIITLGAALLGYVAAEMLITDRAWASAFASLGSVATVGLGLAGAAAVVLVGQLRARRKRATVLAPDGGPQSR
jgi:YjbE family integral membrane protein